MKRIKISFKVVLHGVEGDTPNKELPSVRLSLEDVNTKYWRGEGGWV